MTAPSPFSNTSHIPAPLLDVAFSAGLDAAATVTRWARYTEWHERHHGEEDFRVADWRRHVAWEVEDQRKAAPKPLTDDEQSGVRRLRQHELEAAIADETYRRDAISFGDWIKHLEARESGHGAPLEPHEAAFLVWRREQLAKRSSRNAWGLTAIISFGSDGHCRCHGGTIECQFRARRRAAMAAKGLR